MLRHPGHPCLCLFHARAESQLVETENIGSELAQTISGDFMTATDINYAVGRLYTAVVQDRIPIRSANALAHIGHMPRSSQEPARRSHIRHSNTTQTRHSERREESLFAFDFRRTLSTHGRRIRRNING
jgi:hypothetical protein